jgi:hypothetical protein
VDGSNSSSGNLHSGWVFSLFSKIIRSCGSSLRFLGVLGPKVLLLVVEAGADPLPLDGTLSTPAVVLGGAQTAFGGWATVGPPLPSGLTRDSSGAPLTDRGGQGVSTRLISRRAESGNRSLMLQVEVDRIGSKRGG